MIRAIAVLATTIPLFSPIIIRNNIFCDVKIFPMLAGNEYTIDFTYLLTPGEKSDIVIKHTFSKRTKTVFSKSIISSGELNDSFTIVLDDFVVTNSITMHAQSEKHGDSTQAFTLNVSMELPRINLEESSVFNNPKALIEIDEYGKLWEYYEDISFHNFYKYYELSSSLYFDISELEITYENNYYYELSKFGQATLGFNDINNLFPRLNESPAYNAKTLELELIEEEIGFVKFAFKNTLYVDKTTRMMSLTHEDGFIETSKFYFPVNRHDLIDGLEFFIHFKHIGILDQEFVYYSTYKPQKRIVGDCLTSNYCLIANETDLDDSGIESVVYERD